MATRIEKNRSQSQTAAPSTAPEYSPARVQTTIRILRGQRVMLDEDLAGLYEVEVRALNQATLLGSRSDIADAPAVVFT